MANGPTPRGASRGASAALPPSPQSSAAAAAAAAIARLAAEGQWTAAAYPLVGGVGHVATNFGQRRGTSTAPRRHKGVDIWAIPRGTGVIAANAGTTEHVYDNPRHATGFGIVLLTHNGRYRESYFHLVSAPTSAVGQEISAGALLGGAGMTGRADGIHLHFQVFDVARRTYVNPRPALLLARAAGQARLAQPVRNA